MTRRRIFMTTDAVGGVWQYATDLSAELCRSGHRVTLALFGPPPGGDQRRQAERIEGLRLVETGQPLDWLSDGPEPVERAAQAIAELARHEGADLVHCNAPILAGAADFAMPLVTVTHGCLATWWQATRREPLPQRYHWHYDMMRRGLTAAGRVVAPSAGHAGMVQRTYGLAAPPVVVHNGRRAPCVAENAASPLEAALTVGRLWDEAKNTALLDEVAGRIATRFLAAGALVGPQGETLSLSHMQHLGLLEETQLARLLAQRPIFVSAARFEPFGLAVLEAATAECPLVLSDIPTFRELWDGAAVFIKPADANGFARAIKALAGDLALRRQLGTAAARRARCYTPAASAAAMTRIYDSVLENRRAAA